MKHFPLVWAALWRKPTESILTWLAVTVAFALFGLMIGTRITSQRAIESERMDRLYVNSRENAQLPIHLEEQLARFQGISGVGAFNWLGAYYQDPSHNASVLYVDEGMRRGWPEMRSMNAARWDQLFASPSGVFVSAKTAGRLNLKKGDPLPLISPSGARADGDLVWHFEVLDVVPDDPSFEGVIIGNYHYIDSAKTLATQGRVGGFRVAVINAAQSAVIAQAIDRYFANSDSPTLSVPARIAAENMARSSMDMATQTLYIAAAGLFMVLFVAANGIAQSVRERIPEFAVLQTLGFTHRGVIGLVFAEAALQCVPAALLGMGLASLLSRWPLKFLPSDLAHLPLPTLTYTVFAWAVILAVILAGASAAIPVLRLRTLHLTDALAGR